MNGNLQAVAIAFRASQGGFATTALSSALAFTGEKRLQSFPDLPLASETLPDFHVKGWFALMAPANTPESIVSQIRDDLRGTLEDPGLRNRYEEIGTFPHPASIEETHAFIKAEQDMWRPIVRQIGARSHGTSHHHRRRGNQRPDPCSQPS